MNLSNPRRLLKLATSLVRPPRDLPDYCRYHSLRGRLPADVGLPWWSFAAIRAVKKFCTGAEDVFEFGSGGFTIFLAGLCRRVTAVEGDAAWCARMRKELARRALPNVELRLCPFDFQRPAGFADSDYLRAVAGQTYDLIVVDGSWRDPQLRDRHRARTVEHCEGVGPCRVGVTSTDLFYY